MAIGNIHDLLRSLGVNRDRPPDGGRNRPDAVPPEDRADQVSLSPEAVNLSLQSSDTAARAERIAALRAAIEDGTYKCDDPSKLRAVVDRLIEKLY